MSEVSKAAAIMPPVDDGVIVVAGNSTAKLIKFPEDWRKQWCTIQADGVKVGYLYGDATVVADLAAVSTVAGDGVVTFGTSETAVCPDGGERPVDLSQILPHERDLYVSVITPTTTGHIRLIRSSGMEKAL